MSDGLVGPAGGWARLGCTIPRWAEVFEAMKTAGSAWQTGSLAYIPAWRPGWPTRDHPVPLHFTITAGNLFSLPRQTPESQ